MACNQKIIYKYNSYITRKIPYRRMSNRIRIVKLSKQPLSMVYKEKEKYILLARTKRISIIQKVRKSRGLQDQKELVIEP